MERKHTRSVNVGGLLIGGGNPIVVQSMTNTDTTDIHGTVDQIQRLAAIGCELVRVAVPTLDAAKALKQIKRLSPVPLVADIHFDHGLALAALDAGVDKLRINPGNMGGKALKTVGLAALQQRVPIRVGVNSGSIHRRYRHLPRVEALVKSALHYCSVLTAIGCESLVASLKSSSVIETYQASLEFAAKSDVPLHLGVTEAGTAQTSAIKSAIGIGALLLRGIGDTLRVSVTGTPESEIPIAFGILRALDLRPGVDVISCPTCGRSGYDVAAAATAVEKHLQSFSKPLKVAVMGCAVNGPGEARHADCGIAFGPAQGVLFMGGKVIKTMANEELTDALLNLIAAQF